MKAEDEGFEVSSVNFWVEGRLIAMSGRWIEWRNSCKSRVRRFSEGRCWRWKRGGLRPVCWPLSTPGIRLIESPNVPIIGVGEGTWPPCVEHCSDWGCRKRTSFTTRREFQTGYLVSRLVVSRRFGACTLQPSRRILNESANYWLTLEQSGAFADFVTPQADVVSGLAPKRVAPRLANGSWLSL